LGPSSYDPKHKLVEPRTDALTNILPEHTPFLTDKDTLTDINPDINAIKPNKMTFKYHQPSDKLGPKHTPDKDLFPERWRFYDIDLNVVREELARDIYFSGGLNLNK